jgi:protein gp37
MGVSVENAEVLDRVDYLRSVPAALRFLSCEPLLDPLDGVNLDEVGWVIAGGELTRSRSRCRSHRKATSLRLAAKT